VRQARCRGWVAARLVCGAVIGAIATGCVGLAGSPGQTGRAGEVVVSASERAAAVATPVPRVPLAVTADTLFWRTLHAGAYDQIPRVMTLLKAAYLQNPRDAQTTAHVGFLHAWAGAERVRLAEVPPTITDQLILARTFFARAAALDPTDARVQGFHAVFEMSDATIQRDSAAFAAGLARGRAAIAAWPEFNWFTIGYSLSGRDHASPLFREGLEMQWKTLDACNRTAIDRTNPTMAALFQGEAAEQDPRRRRACWNSWIAPHNVEGFFLNMGDMLVKSGDWQTGVKIYAIARGMSSYPQWAYRDVLEARIANAEQNVAAFRRPEAGADSPRILLGSKIACVACHQR